MSKSGGKTVVRSPAHCKCFRPWCNCTIRIWTLHIWHRGQGNAPSEHADQCPTFIEKHKLKLSQNISRHHHIHVKYVMFHEVFESTCDKLRKQKENHQLVGSQKSYLRLCGSIALRPLTKCATTLQHFAPNLSTPHKTHKRLQSYETLTLLNCSDKCQLPKGDLLFH